MSWLNECFAKNDNIIILSNIIFFIVFQTLFFYFVASNQFIVVISEKLSFFKIFLKNNPEYKTFMKQLNESDTIINLKNASEEQTKKRKEINFKLLGLFCGIPFGIAVLLLLFFYVCKSPLCIKNEWNTFYTVMLMAVVFAYATEMFLYFMMIRQYQFIGDYELINKVF